MIKKYILIFIYIHLYRCLSVAIGFIPSYYDNHYIIALS